MILTSRSFSSHDCLSFDVINNLNSFSSYKHDLHICMSHHISYYTYVMT